ncbi:MAG: MFS transporter [Planctomycetota bacterium]|nr:MAG: MFS transporter [Planctomycetota bacterium]REK26724.1 MAG: MFS transporter [Planctomycetota bacterium]REK35615.1 MAG: MFS transporter [Planctomycetota bacterium]
MNRTTFRLVLLVSCAHAMVHTFEHALPAVEQMIGEEFDVGREQTGALGTVWRLPFGLAAMLAGWLADRYGAKRLLLVYLLGCVAASIMAAWSPSLAVLFAAMFLMGCFASIYHPAGLSLISRATTPADRGRALGWHGIFGAVGIAAAPCLASIVFSTGLVGWRGFYLVISGPALLIAVMITQLADGHGEQSVAQPNRSTTDEAVPPGSGFVWSGYLLLVSAGALSGLVYAAFLHFLPRYLNDTGLRPSGWSEESFRNALTTVALSCAIFGQAIAGRLARPEKLKWQLAVILFANVPPLLWMAVADGVWRFVAACLLALIHFMNQPVYNSLIAQMTPAARRSVGYGFSNMVCFGIGAMGPLLAGILPTERAVYSTLGGVAALAGVAALVLTRLEEGEVH